MPKVALYNKYRPQTFEDVCEQEAIITILKNQIETHTTSNVYLFVGPAGTGKTTVSRILAKAVNNYTGSPIEMDAASNNGVDNIRDIIVRASQQALDSEYKVFILDEVHALSGAAWSAMLKLIEEPPRKTIFILCTTEVQKIPQTILSRVQRFDFRRLSFNKIVERLQYILQCEGITAYEKSAVDYIAKLSEGGMRSAISYLDTCLSLDKNLTLNSVLMALGSVDYNVLFRLTNNLIDRKEQDIIDIIDSIHNNGMDLKLFVKDYKWFILDIVKYTLFQDFSHIKIPKTYEANLVDMLNSFPESSKFFRGLLEGLNQLSADLVYETDARAMVEMKLLMLSWSL